MAVFVLQVVQFILSVPLIGIAFYIVAVFGSCVQLHPQPECGEGRFTVIIDREDFIYYRGFLLTKVTIWVLDWLCQSWEEQWH